MPRDTPRLLTWQRHKQTLPNPLLIRGWPRAVIPILLILFFGRLSFVFLGSNNAMMPRVRLAKPADVDSITKVVLQAMPFDPQWNYRFPYRKQFPDDHYKYTKMLYEQFANPANDDWRLVVVELTSAEKRQQGWAEKVTDLTKGFSRIGGSSGPGLAATTTEQGEIVALSVWDVSYINKKKLGPSYQPQNPMLYVAKHGGSTRRDMNPARQKAFIDSGVESEKYFAKYGNDRITLQILATHPDHWRQGYATSLCQYGMQIAANEGLVLTLVAGERGGNLYRNLNFTSLGMLVKQVPGEEEKVLSEAMVFDPKDQAVSNL